MAFIQKDGSGALFKNERKTQQNHPDYQGSVTISGVAYDLAAWLKDGNKGKWMSLSVRPKQDRPEQNQRAYAPLPNNNDDRDVPF